MLRVGDQDPAAVSVPEAWELRAVLGRLRGMRAISTLLVAAVLAVGCGEDADDVVVGGSELVPSGVEASGVEPPDVPVGEGGLANCEDLPELRSRLEGKLGGRQNPDPIIDGVLLTYGMEHPDTFAGRWIDRDSGGVLMMGFTDDPEPHRAAILARRPTPDDYPAVDPPPPITDDRPLGERDDVVIDVVRVRFSLPEMEALLDETSGSIPSRKFGLDGTGYDITRQRMTLYLVNPPEGALEEIADRVPDPSAVCVEVTRTPQPPEGPLAVIPDLDVEDPVVSCPGTPPVRYSQMIAPPSIDDIDHPAVDVLRTELDTPGGEPLPRGRWVVISIDDDSATFAALSEHGFGVAGVERRGDRWIFTGQASGPRCEPTIPLPAGLAPVEVLLDPDSMPDPGNTTVDVLVSELGCASGREMGDALRGPQVIETDDAVVVAFAVVPIAGSATCPGNPWTAVTVELSEPLGERWIYDGLFFPPKPLVAVADPLTSSEYRDSYPCRSGSAFVEAQGTEGTDTFDTANRALMAHLGDLSEPLYDIEVAERGHGYERWRIAIEDSSGEVHLGTVQARRSTEGRWHIEQAQWCLTDAGHSDTVRNGVASMQRHLQPPADFSDCPMVRDHHQAPEALPQQLPTPGAVLAEHLSPLPTVSLAITLAESTQSMVRWEIMTTGALWGPTITNTVAVEDNGWRLQTDQWCHLEPQQL